MKFNWFKTVGLAVSVIILAVMFVSCSGKTEGVTSAVTTSSTDPSTVPVTDPSSVPLTNPSTDPITSPVTDPSETEVMIISADIQPTVVYPLDNSVLERDAADRMRGLVRTVSGKNASAPATDNIEKAGPEILLGLTGRAISAYANEIYGQLKETDDDLVFVIYASGDSIAVIFDHELSLSSAMAELKTHIKDGKLSFEEGETLTGKVSLSAYLEEQKRLEEEALSIKKQKNVEDYEKRFTQIETTFDSASVTAIKSLANSYGEEVITLWLANLWDPQVGGFYYSNSARDNIGFLPDVESTNQGLRMISTMGSIDVWDNDLDKALPDSVKSKIVAFVQSLEDPDGYFYHPQWGKNIGSSRRGRDLSWSTAILNWFHADPPYPTALDSSSSEDTVANTDSVTLKRLLADSIKKKLPKNGFSEVASDYLQSEEAFLAYLNSFDWDHNSHGAGHTLSSQKQEIKAAGLIDVCCDFLDSKQNPETGLWGLDPANYSTLSGLFKICMVYSTAGRQIKHCDKIVAAAIDVICSDVDPSVIIYVYNPITALKNIFSNMKATNKTTPSTYDMDAFYALLYSHTEEIFTVTQAKLAKFRKTDGSYSYNQKSSAPTTQGTSVSLGENEGDLNATCIALTIWNDLMTLFNMDKVPLYNVTTFDKFLPNLLAIEEVVKKENATKEVSFEEEEFPTNMSATGAGSEINIVEDNRNQSNHVLRVSSPSGTGTSVIYQTPHMMGASDTAIVFETDLMVESSDRDYAFQLSLGDGNTIFYMLDILVEGSNVVLRENPTTSNVASAVRFDNASFKVGKWVNLRLESYPGTKDSVRFKIYIDGYCYAIGTSFYGCQDESAEPRNDYQTVKFYTMKSAKAVYYLDNLKNTLSTQAFSDEDLTTPDTEKTDRKISYTFEKGNQEGMTLAVVNTDTATIVTDPKNDKNKVLCLNKPTAKSGTGTLLTFDTDVNFIAGKTLIVEFDFYLDSVDIQPAKSSENTKPKDDLNHTLFQIFIGGMNAGSNEGIYLLTMKANQALDGFCFGDAVSTNVGCTDFGPTYALDTWYHITLEITLGTTAADFACITSVDGKVINTSNVHFNQERVSEHAPNTVANSITIKPQMRSVLVSYFDNISVEVKTEE